MKLYSFFLLLSLFAHYSHGWWVTLPAHQDGCFGAIESAYQFKTEGANSKTGTVPKVKDFFMLLLVIIIVVLRVFFLFF